MLDNEGFSDELVTILYNEKWIIKVPFSFIATIKNVVYQVDVPFGFKSDFASIPRIFWPILSPFGNYAQAAVVHDLCYREGLFTRKISDKLMKKGMKYLKVGYWQILIIYFAIRIFGKHAYRERKNEN